MDRLDQLATGLEAAARVVVVAIFAFMLGVVLLDVLARNSAFRVRGLDELARIAQIWMIFLIAGASARYGELIGTNVLVDLLPRRGQIVAWFVARVLLLVFLAVLGWYAWLLLEFLIGTKQRSPNLRFPMWWAYLPLFVGTALMFLSLAVDLMVRLRDARAGGDLLAPPDLRKGSAPWS